MSSEQMIFKPVYSINRYIDMMHPTGSMYICQPAVYDTDEDYVVLVKTGCWEHILDALWYEGWDAGGSMQETYSYETGFLSFKKLIGASTINLIVTADMEFYLNFILATHEAKNRNLLDKEERVALFQEYLYEAEYDEAIFL